MRTKARVSRGLGALVLASGALLAASGADATAADDLPVPATPAAPQLLSATVTGCQAPCAPGETGQVSVTYQHATATDGQVLTVVYFNGVGIQWKSQSLGNPTTETFTICASRTEPSAECINPITRVDAVRGAETITARSYTVTGNPDDGTQRASALSEPSNAIVATQG